MPIELSTESRADPTHTLDLINEHEKKLALLVKEYLEEIKSGLREQGFANRVMSTTEFLRWVDTLASKKTGDRVTWTKEWVTAAYGQGRRFSSVVLGAPIEVRQAAWKRVGILVERADRAFAKMSGDMSADVRRVISDGILREGSQGDMIKAINGLADTYDYAAKRIVRTETMTAVNTGVMDGYRAHDVDKVEWLAASGCCDRCQALDGHVFAIDGGIHAPLHPNCRCTVIPVVDIPGQAPREAEAWEEDE